MCNVHHTSILGLYSAAFKDTIQIEVDFASSIGKSVSDNIFVATLNVGVAGCKCVYVGRRQCSSVCEGRNECRDDGDGSELHIGGCR